MRWFGEALCFLIDLKKKRSIYHGIQCSLFSFMNFMKDDDLHESAWVFPSLLYCAYMLTVQYFEDN